MAKFWLANHFQSCYYYCVRFLIQVQADLEQRKFPERSESPKVSCEHEIKSCERAETYFQIKLLVKNPNPVSVDVPNFSLGFEASPTDGRRPFNEQLRKLTASSRHH